MSEENEIIEDDSPLNKSTSDYKPGNNITVLSGMYQDWFLDYASYVILERAVPHINDGLKPVQRRIMHAMKKLDDGRYNKVANIIGYTMQYHPHGDASIGDALVQLGQKDLLIDAQGNWGNIFTGDNAAAPRYIEARLSKFASEIVFNPKITEWKNSYDGRNEEPITLPVKFPLLLAQGVEGIAVGLASKILPHNFCELIEASIKYLKGESFEIYPDFITGGMADCSRYNDGLRGGNIKVRARIKQYDKKTLSITEIPFGKTTSSLIDSIIKANDKGKIKIKKIDDNTAEFVEILVHLVPGISPDKTIDALYAFTDCEIPISPNCCVVDNEKPRFIGVSELLKYSTNHTVELLRKELEIKKQEYEEQLFMSSLEKIFIEEKIFHDIEDCTTWPDVIKTIHKGLEPHKAKFLRKITDEDVTKLTEIKIKRITKFDTKKADEEIKELNKKINAIKVNLSKLIEFAINYFSDILQKYGKGKERKTELRSFETIAATEVIVANEKLYVNRLEGFVGTSLKKDEYIGDCSELDDVIVIRSDGSYIITKVSDKTFVGKNIQHIAVFRKNDLRTIYNIIYTDGATGITYIKRCPISGLTRDKEYHLTQGTENSKLLYLSTNPNGEAEIMKVYLKPRPKVKNLILEINFADLAIKGKNSLGNIATRFPIHKVVLQEKGESTLGGAKIWYDTSVNRLNSEGKGLYLGEFMSEDKIIEICKSGNYRLCGFDLSTHFNDDVMILEKFNPNKIYSAVYFDAEQKYYYLKRFTFESTTNYTNFIDEHPESKLILISSHKYPQFELIFGGKNWERDSELIDADEFIAIKSFRAKGKRLSTYEIVEIKESDPLDKGDSDERNMEPEDEEIQPSAPVNDEDVFKNKDKGSQMSLF